MDNLRWILLGIGILVLGIIYFSYQWRRRAQVERAEDLDEVDEGLLQSLQVSRDDSGRLGEDQLTGLDGIRGERLGHAAVDPADLSDWAGQDPQPADEPGAEAGAIRIREKPSRVYSVEPKTRKGSEELVIVLNVMAEPGQAFSGAEAKAALAEVDMQFGAMQIFHHYGVGEATSSRPVFSLANILEPGIFDPQHMDAMDLPGLCLFLRLPGPLDGQVAFELMLNTGYRLADILGGELRDETRSVVTQQTVAHLRERIADFGRRQMIG